MGSEPPRAASPARLKPQRHEVDPRDVHITAIRAQGAGGQNINKVSNAVHLRFDVRQSSLPDEIRQRLLSLSDARITREGVVVIKAQAHRSLELNRAEALQRLQELVDEAAHVPAVRRATRPTRASRERRLQSKQRAAQTKALRSKLIP